LKEFLGRRHFEYVIIVCGEADKECPAIFGTARRLVWPFDDPAKAVGTEAEVLDACRKVRDQMAAKILEWLKNDPLI
jgi:arsenate reductase